MNDIEQMLTVKDVAGLLKLSIASIWRLAKQGKLPAPIKIGANSTRWKKSELVAWMGAAV